MLLIFIFAIFFASSAIGAPQSWYFRNKFFYLDGKIIGGVNATIEEFPYQVSVQEYGENNIHVHICGGAIISSDYVLTAAHCIRFFPDWYGIRAGSSVRNSGGVEILAETIYIHPKYNFMTAEYDIAILKLETPLTFSASIAPVPLPSQNQQIPDGAEGIVTGWGDLEEGTWLGSDLLQAVTVPIMNQAQCEVFYEDHWRDIAESMICAGFAEGGKDACQGDSGGPLVVNGQLVGLVSWGRGCARPESPGVYARVPHVRSFIYEITGV
uniref:Serine protease 2 n=1 Tax=Holotrichia oblita TaxID=644536 RepID=A0A8D4IZ02_HOLOL|nr:serine protease 2 [Holotrichia oblita]